MKQTILILFILIMTNITADDFKASKGVMDLRKYNFDINKPIRVDGEWEVYFGKIILPSEFEKNTIKKEYLNVPAENGNYPFESYKKNGIAQTQYTVATYHITILLDKYEGRLALSIPENYTAYDLWINGKKELSCGKVGENLKEERPKNIIKQVYLDKGIEKLDIVFNMSNFHYIKGGFQNPVVVGKAEKVKKDVELNIFYESICIGILFIIGLYHIILFLLFKRDKASLYLGLICILLGIRSLFQGMRIATYFFEDFNWELSEKIQFITTYIAPPVYIAFVGALFNSKLSKWALWISSVVSVPLVLISIFVNARSYEILLNTFYILLIFELSSIVFVLTEQVWKKESRAVVILSGTVIFFVTVVNDALNERGIIASVPMSLFGFVTFIIFQAYILAVNFSEAFYQNEELTKKLEESNAHLEEKVKERTRILEEKTKEAEAATKAKGEFLANMSHEIRTPMNAILGFAGAALRIPLSPTIYNYIQKIEMSTKSLLGIINDILDFSKIEAGKLEIENIPFAVDDVVGNIVTIVAENATEKGLVLQWKVDKDIPKVLIGDPLRMGQILLNLANNAVKFTVKGKITIGLSLLEKNEENCKVECFVEDTGIGMSKEEVDKLFTAFTQADSSVTRKYGGTGLGLSICKQLAKLMNGEILVESEYGKGSKFIFRGIYKYSKNEKIINEIINKKEVIVENELLLKNAEVLLVEDIEMNQEIAKIILENYGIRVDVAENGKKAIDAVIRKNYNLILMDMHMPEMGGLEATKIIRSKGYKDVPIVAMTAHALAGVKEECLEAGMNDYLSKPFNEKQLYNILNKWIDHKKIVINNSLPNERIENIYEVEEIPKSINGIDVQEALERMAGKKSFLKKVLLSFYNEYKDAVKIIEEHLANKRYKEIAMLIHSIKGVAGSISANRIYESIVMFEKELREGNEANFSAVFHGFKNAMEELLNALEKMPKK